MPGNEKTWSIEPVHILPDDDSDSEDGGTVVEGKSPAKPISDISQFLLQARKASVDSHSRESVCLQFMSSVVTVQYVDHLAVSITHTHCHSG